MSRWAELIEREGLDEEKLAWLDDGLLFWNEGHCPHCHGPLGDTRECECINGDMGTAAWCDGCGEWLALHPKSPPSMYRPARPSGLYPMEDDIDVPHFTTYPRR